MDSKVGLLLQLNCVIVITVLSLLLRRSLRLTALKYWALAWLCESFALISLRLAFEYSDVSTLLFSYFYLGRYLFAFFLIAGVRSLSSDFVVASRSEFYFLPLAGLAIFFASFMDFHSAIPYHALVMCALSAVAFFRSRALHARSFGWHLLYVALGMKAVNYAVFVGLFSSSTFLHFGETALTVSSIVTLVLQAALGIGMVIVLFERVLGDYQSANTELKEAKQRLEELVHTDPLTAAFNRHAFYGFVSRGEEASGCVGFFDIDGLKGINDDYGHAVGDMAIRQVVTAIRDIIRAEDLIYRWGGDEFFVIMISMNAEMAEQRMARLNSLLREVKLTGAETPMTIGVSWGFKDFAGLEDLERSIIEADAEMYRRKKLRKAIIGEPEPVKPVSSLTPDPSTASA